MKYDKISIITPSFNQGHFLEQTIDSVLSQNYPSLEYIIIDGGSTDNSIDIIKKYEKYLTYWISEPDSGQSEAINKGLRQASGDIVNWINSDDYYQNDILKFIADAFSDKTVNVVCGKGNIVDEKGLFIRSSHGTDVYEGNQAKTIGWARIDQPETFLRRVVFNKIGLLDERLHYVMDKAWWINYLLVYGLNGVKKLDQTLTNFRLHDTSKTSSRANLFEQETNGLFCSLAKLYCFHEESQLIHSLEKSTNNLDCSFANHQNNIRLIKGALHYFLLLKADEYYYKFQNKKAKMCLDFIEPQHIAANDLKLLKKLKFRSKVPSILRVILKKYF